MRTITRLTLTLALLLAMPVWADGTNDILYGPAQYPTVTCVGSCQDVVEPMNRKSFTDLIDPECKSWTTLYPPWNPSCLSGLSGGCVQICTERQKKEVCTKRPELVGCEGSPCTPAHLLALLQQQAEFVEPEPKIMVGDGETYHIPPTLTEMLCSEQHLTDWRKKREQLTEEVQQTLKECK